MFHTYLQVFYLDVVYVLHGFQVFYGCFCNCFICLQTYVASVASGCFKNKSDVASRSLLAFDCLASVYPPSLGAGWASRLEAQAGATPSPLLLNAGDAACDTGALGDEPP